MIDDAGSIEIRAAFDSPEQAIPAADAMVEAGFKDVQLYVVLEASIRGNSDDLQRVHDRMKDLPPGLLPDNAEVTIQESGD